MGVLYMSAKKLRHPEPQKVPAVLGFAAHSLRPAPIEGDLISMAAEIGALLNRHDAEIERQRQAMQALEKSGQAGQGRVAQLVYHLGQALVENEPEYEQAGLKHVLKQLQILKDLLQDTLEQQGISWRDPTGEMFEGALVEMVEVDGWRHAPEYHHEVVADTREPIVLCKGRLVLPGTVVIGAPRD
jgi:hypothetical protein